jgi:chaperonin cofactor prefoldin
VLPTAPLRDDAARREIARLAALLEELQREIRTQFTRMAQMQAELDELKRVMQETKR